MIRVNLFFILLYWLSVSLYAYCRGIYGTISASFFPLEPSSLFIRFLSIVFILGISFTIRAYCRRKKFNQFRLIGDFRLCDCLPVPIVITEREGKILYINKNFKDMTGFLSGDIKGKNILKIAGDSQAKEAIKSVYCQAAREHLPCECRITLRSKSSSRQPVKFKITPYFDGKKNAVYLVWSAEAVSEEKPESLAQESEREYKKIIDNIGIGISLISLSGKRLYVNKQMRRWFPSSDGSSQSICHDIFCDFSPQMCDKCPTCQTLKKGDVNTSFMKTASGDKSLVYKVVTFPIKDSKNKPMAAIEMVEDYTKIDKQEEQIRRNYLVQAVMNSLLRFSLESISLEGFLDCALNIILSTPWFSAASKGAVYLVEDDPDLLLLKVQNNLLPQTVSGYEKIPFGQGVCGSAAGSGTLQFSKPVSGADAYQSHGHYCVPIAYAKKIVGVMDIYLKEGHYRLKQEEDFLNAVANTLAGVIQRMRSEERVSKINEGFISLGADPFANIQRLVVLGGEILAAGFVFYSRFNYQEDAFYSSGQYNASPESLESIKLYEKTCRETAERQKGFFVIEDPGLYCLTENRRTLNQFRTCMGQTVYCAGEPAGVLCVFYATSVKPANDDKKLLGIIVSALGTEEERIRANEKLKQAYDELKKAQYTIVQSEKLAALGRFSSGIAHEVKNPLGIILGGIEFLEQKLAKADKDSIIAAKKIKEATMRADSILRNLLKFASPSELKTGKVDIKDVVEETISFFKYRASLANVDIISEYPQECVLIDADKNLLQQVLFNLLVNASDAIDEKGQIRIKIYKTAPDEIIEGKPASVVEVVDSGEGISKENMSKLFEPFFTTKRDKKGTGLGLSISKMIVENHGGVLFFESVLGKGTVAKMVLPLAEENH
jgi:PAS domain S-box-containing protein